MEPSNVPPVYTPKRANAPCGDVTGILVASCFAPFAPRSSPSIMPMPVGSFLANSSDKASMPGAVRRLGSYLP